MAELYYRNASGDMVPLIDFHTTEADAKYVPVTGGDTGPIIGPSATAGSEAVTMADADLPAGIVMPFAGATAPDGWLICDGSAVSRTTYADLFTAIGTTFGVGDGSTTFNLPGIRTLTPIGGTSLNDKPGASTVTISAAQMPNSTGQIKMHGSSDGAGGWRSVLASSTGVLAPSGGGNTYQSHATASTGAGSHNGFSLNLGFGGGSHENRQPYIAMHYMIRT
jgi:microcystin-dependent protein